MIRVKMLLLALFVALVGLLATAGVSHADTGDRSVFHAADNGFDGPFFVKCPNYTYYHVHEGQGTGSATNGCFTGSGSSIHVAEGNEIVCRTWYGWGTEWDATGWHVVGVNVHKVCVHQRD